MNQVIEMNQDEKIKQMEKTLKYAYKDIDYLLKIGHGTDAQTVTTRLYSSISNGELDSIANTLADIKDLLGKIE